MPRSPVAPSGAALDLADDLPDDLPDPGFAGPREERYERGGTLGRGGMGVVEVARDLSLHRDVALKRTHRGDPRASARLVREARLAALLEHPGIVPVYDAGVLGDGQPFYTMRLLPGRTLGDVIESCNSVQARLKLVRHVMEAAEAIAYAHRRGVFHRDLKPANILVGAPGETVVADWGLACTRDEARGDLFGPVGTPGYMSPEQALGARIDERSDVYGLGAVLFEVIAGAAPTSCPVPVASTVRDVPPELAAITDRALQLDPRWRYPDAAAFASDLAAWFEGRRVAAHTYGAVEILRRVWRQWRPLLVVSGVAMLGVLVVLTAGWVRTTQERDRAIQAERAAVSAESVARLSLAEALVAHARTAATEGRALAADLYATQSLALAESPRARGVRARFSGRPRLALVETLPFACERGVASPDATEVACNAGGVLQWHRVDGSAHRETLAEVSRMAVSGGVVLYSDAGNRLFAWNGLDAARLVPSSGARVLRIAASPTAALFTVATSSGTATVDAIAGTWALAPSCPGEPGGIVVGLPEGGSRHACDSGRVADVGVDGRARAVEGLAPEDGAPILFAVDPEDAGRFAVATARSRVVVWDAGRVVQRFDTASQQATSVSLRGDRLAVVRSDGALVSWEVSTGRPVAQMRVPGGGIAWEAGGNLLVLDHGAVRRWSLPTGGRFEVVRMAAGVSAVGLSPDGRRFGASLGDGSVVVYDADRGAQVVALPAHGGVAKDVAFSPDGTLIASVGAGESSVRIHETKGWLEHAWLPLGGGRRLAWVRGGLLVATYAEGLPFWDGGGVRAVAMPQFAELDADLAGDAAWALDTGDNVWRVDGAGEPKRLGRMPGAIGVAGLGDRAAVVTRTGLQIVDGTGAVGETVKFDVGALEVAAAPDHGRIAVGHVDGQVTLWTGDGTGPVAILEGHSGRVAGLSFSLDGQWLYTGSWDESVRAWFLGDLETPAATLRSALESDLGESIEVVLSRELAG